MIKKLLRTFAFATLISSAYAQDATFPARPLRIIAASVPGTLVDQAARLYAERMAVFLKQPVVVENVAGASSLLAVRQLLKSAPDGYTLMVVANTVVTTPHVNPKAGYALREFTPIGELVRSPVMLVVPGTGPHRALADLVEFARRSPGKLTFGSSGIGTTNHLAVELLARQANVTFTHVPYKGIAAAVPDVVAGRVDFLMGTATSVVEVIRSGTLRALAISAERRSSKFPDVPTLAELGYPEATFQVWIGTLGPAGIAPARIARLGAAMEAARGDVELVRRLEAVGQEISAVRTADQFAAVLREDEDKLRRVIRAANIVSD